MPQLIYPSGLVRAPGVIREPDPWNPANLTWTEAHASTPVDFGGLMIYSQNASVVPGIIFIAVGAPGSEQIIIDIPFVNGSVRPGVSFDAYVSVPAGSRISVAAAVREAQTIFIDVRGKAASMYPAGSQPFSRITSGPYNLEDDVATYGAWVTIDPGPVQNTKGAWIELSQAGTNAANNNLSGDSLPALAQIDILQAADMSNTTHNNENFYFDYAFGAPGSEDIIILDSYRRTRTIEVETVDPNSIIGPISAATRVSGRASSTSSDAIDRLMGALMIGYIE